MNILRPGAVVGGLLMSSPTIYAALVDETAGVDAAIFRFLLGVLLCGVGLSIYDAITATYGGQDETPKPKPSTNPYGANRRAADVHPTPMTEIEVVQMPTGAAS